MENINCLTGRKIILHLMGMLWKMVGSKCAVGFNMQSYQSGLLNPSPTVGREVFLLMTVPNVRSPQVQMNNSTVSQVVPMGSSLQPFFTRQVLLWTKRASYTTIVCCVFIISATLYKDLRFSQDAGIYCSFELQRRLWWLMLPWSSYVWNLHIICVETFSQMHLSHSLND